jgi:hypothetical protein
MSPRATASRTALIVDLESNEAFNESKSSLVGRFIGLVRELAFLFGVLEGQSSTLRCTLHSFIIA